MKLSKRIFKTKTNNRKQLGWAFGFALSCMNMFAQDGINEERLPRARFEKQWDRYEKVMSRGGNSFISYFFRDTVSIDEMVEAFRTNKEKTLFLLHVCRPRLHRSWHFWPLCDAQLSSQELPREGSTDNARCVGVGSIWNRTAGCTGSAGKHAARDNGKGGEEAEGLEEG